METKSLYHINQEQLVLMSQLEENGGELTPELEEALIINAEDLTIKADAYMTVIKGKEATIEMLDKEIKRLTAMKKTEDNQIKRLKSFLLNAVTAFGKFNTDRFKFSTRNSEAVEIENEELLPEDYWVIKQTPNKAAIKAALKGGAEINGATLKTNTSLNVR